MEKASQSEPTVYAWSRNRLRDWNRPREPYASYVIYDDGPRKIFHGWNPQGNFHTRQFEKIRDTFRPNPSLSYQSVYSNTIKVYEDPVYGQASENRFGFDSPPSKPDYEVHYPHRTDERRYYSDRKVPENFPKIFSPNTGFRFSVFDKPQRPTGPQKTFYADAGYYRTYTVNYPSGNDSASFGEVDNVRKLAPCNFIRLNGQSFPGSDKELCSRADENVPLSLPDYPDYSKFSDREIPVEHRRQNYLKNEIRRRGKRSAGYGYGFDSYSPYGYDRNYNDYYSSYYPSYNDYGNGPDGNYNNYNYNYRNGDYRNRGFSYDDRGYNYGREYGGRYYGLDRDDEYQNSQETSSRGLASFLAEGGRREKSRTRSDNEQDDRDSEDSEEDYKNRRRDMFNNNNSRNNEDRNRMRGPNRSDGMGGGNEDDDEEGDQDRNGQNSYSRNNRRNNSSNGRRYYNSRSDYHNNRNRGSYGHNGNNYGRNNYGGDFDRQNRPSGLYGR